MQIDENLAMLLGESIGKAVGESQCAAVVAVREVLWLSMVEGRVSAAAVAANLAKTERNLKARGHEGSMAVTFISSLRTSLFGKDDSRLASVCLGMRRARFARRGRRF